MATKKQSSIESYLSDLSLDELTALYRDYRDDTSDDGRRRLQAIRSRLVRMKHDDIHPDEEYIEASIPASVTGHPYTINGVPIFGKVRIPKCVFDTIKHMEYMGHQIERERMVDRGSIRDLGTIGVRAQQIQSEA